MKEALDKIHAEVTANAKDKYVQVVGGLLISHIRNNPQDAAHITTEGKTIKGSLKAMSDEAQKNKSGNVGVLTTEEGFNVVLKYFGVTVPEVIVKPTVSSFDISLDDLL